MKTQNTYSLLVNSEEKSRGIFESIVYSLVVASMAFSVFAFVSQSVTLPGKAKSNGTAIEMATTPAPQPPLVASR